MSLTIVNSDNVFQKDVIGNVRKAQEDSHDIAVLTPNGDVFVVCDGMGGHVGGKQASSIAVKCIIEYLQKEKYAQPMQALNDALQFANMQILGYAKEHPELRGMGTTACIVLLQDTEAYIAHVGDSRIYLYMGKEQQLHRITKDHSFVQTLVDAGQITDEEAENHPNKNRILKALGIKLQLVPTCNVVHPKNGDCFLICSDGLNGMISDATIQHVLQQNISLNDKGEQLIQLALQAGGLDNITVELIHVCNSPHAASQFTSFNPVSTERVIPQPLPVGDDKKPLISLIKRIALWGSAIVVFIIVCFLTLCIISIQQSNKELKSVQSEMEQVKRELGEAEKDKEKIKDDIQDEQQLLKDAEQAQSTAVPEINKRIENLKSNLKEKEKDISSLQKGLENYQQKLDSLQNKITQKSK